MIRKLCIILLSLITFLFGVQNIFASESDFSIAQRNLTNYLVGFSSNNTDVFYIVKQNDMKTQELINTITFNDDYLWSDYDDFLVSNNITQTFNNIETLAISYNTKASHYYLDDDLKSVIEDSLIFMQSVYNKDLEITDNWWDYEIGSPKAIVETMLLMNGEIDAKLIDYYTSIVDYFIPDPNYRFNGVLEMGANLVDKSYNVAVNALVSEDTKRLEYALDSLSRAYDYVDSGDGFYSDGSFIQHNNIAYTASYGEVLLKKSAIILYVFDNTIFLDNDNSIYNIYELIKTAFYPLIYNSIIMDSTMGRSYTRLNTTGYTLGKNVIIDSILPLYLSNDKPGLGIIKQMISDNYDDTYLENLSISSAELVLYLLSDDSIDKKTDNTQKTKNFGYMNRYIYEGDGYSVSFSGFSDHISAFENGNGEGLNGFYQNVGSMRIYSGDKNQYDDTYYTTQDPYLVAGTSTNYNQAIHKKEWDSYYNKTNLVNGLTNGSSGIFSIDVNLSDVTSVDTSYKRSFFISDGKIVVLTSDINSDSNLYTTIDSQKFGNDDLYYVNNKESNLKQRISLNDNSNIVLYNSDNDFYTSYYLPHGGYLNMSNVTGNINKLNSNQDQEFSSDVFTLLIKDNNNFDYAIAPNQNVDLKNSYKVIENNDNCQVVQMDDKTFISAFSASTCYNIKFLYPTLMIIEDSAIVIAPLDNSVDKLELSLNGIYNFDNEYDNVEISYIDNETKIIYTPKDMSGSSIKIGVK